MSVEKPIVDGFGNEYTIEEAQEFLDKTEPLIEKFDKYLTAIEKLERVKKESK